MTFYTKSEAAQHADQMQQETRKKQKFAEMESELDPRLEALQASFTSPTADKFLSYLGSRNPLGRPVTAYDAVWLLDNTAFKSPTGDWQAEFVAAVFERNSRPKRIDLVTRVASMLGIADDAEEKKVLEERMMPFLWEIRPARKIKVDHQGKILKLGPTGRNGISTDIVTLPAQPNGTTVKSTAAVSRGATGVLEMKTVFAEPQGWAVISDVDDTIKITQTSDPLGIISKTFVDEPTAIAGMPELYRHIASVLPEQSPWFYVSASPYNLYPFLKDFCRRSFPHGTLILRDASWRTIAGLLGDLTIGTAEYKTSRITKVHSWLPERKIILIGDSTQSDPEAYGDLYREHKGWVKLILIRKAVELAAAGIEAKNEPERFETAFKGIPRDDWHVFEDPAECNDIVERTLSRG